MFKFVSGFYCSIVNMERGHSSGVKTPPTRGVVQKSKNKTYQQSYRSCLRASSRFALTPALTARRLNTSRRAPRLHNITKVRPEHLDILMKTEWKLAYVTPLYQFRHTQLQSYSRQLSEFIAAEKQQGLAVEVEGLQSSFRVSFSVVPGMTEADDDAETVLIQIHSKPMFARQDKPQKPVWSGWLTCINGNPDYLQSLPQDFICLPLFGSSGSEVLTRLVQSWFQQTFDCCFGCLEISETCLHWLAALWTNCHSESSIQRLKLIWTIPVKPVLQVTYTVNPQDAWDLWSDIRKEPGEENEGEDGRSVDIEEVTRFIQGLKNHFYKHFKLDLSAGPLQQVSTALGSAKYSDLQQQIYDHHPHTTDRGCPPQNAHLENKDFKPTGNATFQQHLNTGNLEFFICIITTHEHINTIFTYYGWTNGYNLN
uniref:centromere protein L isoform X2 n=1 Tax=Monopterus albus TaxID=43700 RepID=UPI0009B2EE42|nr:centromere protein L isoform X2 [Monopterus albus]